MDTIKGMWNGVVWFFNPMQDTNQVKQDGQKIGDNVNNTVNNVVDTATGLLPTIKNDLDWLLIAIVGVLAYAFIFKR
jgi:hypothetical protein